jgi:hypothetical protein
MALWRDPLDELIEQLESAVPATVTNPEDSWPWGIPPIHYVQFLMAEVLWGHTPTPEERRCIDQVYAYYERQGKRWAEHSATSEPGAGAVRTTE